ncbi:hypothetical protein, partial [Stenotrophomonas maltophilia]
SGEGEEVRVSERSEFPHRPSAGRGAQGTDAQHRLAPWRRVSLVTFFARAKKVTSTITADTKTAPSQVPSP